ncbi:MAG: RloB domain-containing protein [Sphingobacteriaceae bacterium]|nr:RloB domain-containing protein [Sphingobacteriaceae bacterium]
MLIYCEGKNTEPSYFKHFKLASVTINSFGEGKNTLSLVERAKQIYDESKKNKKYDAVWCVFDADPKPDNPNQLKNFNAAVVKAKKYGFKVAYSNQAFLNIGYYFILMTIKVAQ